MVGQLKEDVAEWYQGLSAHMRIEAMCTLIDLSMPFEIRFLGSLIEHLGRKDFGTLREAESKANSFTNANPEDKKKLLKSLAEVSTGCLVNGTQYVNPLMHSTNFNESPGNRPSPTHNAADSKGRQLSISSSDGHHQHLNDHGVSSEPPSNSHDPLGGLSKGGANKSGGSSSTMSNHIGCSSEEETESMCIANDHKRRKLILYISVLQPTNHDCANLYYTILSDIEDSPALAWLEDLDKDAQEEVSLLYTLASRHPAFTFEQRMFLGRVAVRVNEMISSKFPSRGSTATPQETAQVHHHNNTNPATHPVFFNHPIPQAIDPKYAPSAGYYIIAPHMHMPATHQPAANNSEQMRNAAVAGPYPAYGPFGPYFLSHPHHHPGTLPHPTALNPHYAQNMMGSPMPIPASSVVTTPTGPNNNLLQAASTTPTVGSNSNHQMNTSNKGQNPTQPLAPPHVISSSSNSISQQSCLSTPSRTSSSVPFQSEANSVDGDSAEESSENCDWNSPESSPFESPPQSLTPSRSQSPPSGVPNSTPVQAVSVAGHSSTFLVTSTGSGMVSYGGSNAGSVGGSVNSSSSSSSASTIVKTEIHSSSGFVITTATSSLTSTSCTTTASGGGGNNSHINHSGSINPATSGNNSSNSSSKGSSSAPSLHHPPPTHHPQPPSSSSSGARNAVKNTPTGNNGSNNTNQSFSIHPHPPPPTAVVSSSVIVSQQQQQQQQPPPQSMSQQMMGHAHMQQPSVLTSTNNVGIVSHSMSSANVPHMAAAVAFAQQQSPHGAHNNIGLPPHLPPQHQGNYPSFPNTVSFGGMNAGAAYRAPSQNVLTRNIYVQPHNAAAAANAILNSQMVKNNDVQRGVHGVHSSLRQKTPMANTPKRRNNLGGAGGSVSMPAIGTSHATNSQSTSASGGGGGGKGDEVSDSSKDMSNNSRTNEIVVSANPPNNKGSQQQQPPPQERTTGGGNGGGGKSYHHVTNGIVNSNSSSGGAVLPGNPLPSSNSVVINNPPSQTAINSSSNSGGQIMPTATVGSKGGEDGLLGDGGATVLENYATAPAVNPLPYHMNGPQIYGHPQGPYIQLPNGYMTSSYYPPVMAAAAAIAAGGAPGHMPPSTDIMMNPGAVPHFSFPFTIPQSFTSPQQVNPQNTGSKTITNAKDSSSKSSSQNSLHGQNSVGGNNGGGNGNDGSNKSLANNQHDSHGGGMGLPIYSPLGQLGPAAYYTTVPAARTPTQPNRNSNRGVILDIGGALGNSSLSPVNIVDAAVMPPLDELVETVHRPRKISCYNCGASTHLGPDCKEGSMEEMTRHQFRVNYSGPSTVTADGKDGD